MKRPESKVEPYLKIPYSILNIPDIGLSEKVLLAYIHSFGKKGCWQSNQTIAEVFMISQGTINRWLNRIKKYIVIKNAGAPYRKLFSIPAANVLSLDKTNHRKNDSLPVQKCTTYLRKNDSLPAQKCAATININKINNKTSTAPPCLGPSESRSSAVLEQRHSGLPTYILNSIGRKAPRTYRTQEELEKRRQNQLKALGLGQDSTHSNKILHHPSGGILEALERNIAEGGMKKLESEVEAKKEREKHKQAGTLQDTEKRPP